MTQHWWDGKFSKVGDNLLQYYKSDWGLSPADIQLEQWKIYCSVQSFHPLAFRLFYDTIEGVEEFVMKECYSCPQLSDFWRSTVVILEYSIGFLKTFNFDNERRITNCLKLLGKIAQTVALERLGLMPSNVFNDTAILFCEKKRRSIEDLAVEALKENAETWFRNLVSNDQREQASDGAGPQGAADIKLLQLITFQLLERLHHLEENYQSIFKK